MKKLLLILSVMIACSVYAQQTRSTFNPQLIQLIEDSFLDSQGKVDSQKVFDFVDSVVKRREMVFQNTYNFRTKKKDKSKKKNSIRMGKVSVAIPLCSEWSALPPNFSPSASNINEVVGTQNTDGKNRMEKGSHMVLLGQCLSKRNLEF